MTDMTHTRRLLNIMVERFVEDKETFNPLLVTSLREYTTAIEQGKNGDEDNEVFTASNGCRIKVIAGGFDG